MSTDDTDDLIALRRNIHRHAELPFLEIRTAALVLGELQNLGYEIRTGRDAMRAEAVADYPDAETRSEAARAAVRLGIDPTLATELADNGTAVIADIVGTAPGPAWAIRFDMDALPIVEADEHEHAPTVGGFRSDNGAMHACGHDGNTAIGVMLARRLADRAFAGSVRLLFQPAEEGARGAAAMIPAGATSGINHFLGLHLGNSLPTGTMVGTAVDLQATTKFEATFRGVAAHAAGGPQHGRNALAAAATATMQILALPRSSEGVTNVNVGTFHGGSATNIIPDLTVITGEVRSDSSSVCADLFEGVRRVLDSCAAMYRVEVEVTITAESTTLDSDNSLVDDVLRIAEERFGPEKLRRTAVLSASDDASLLAADVQRNGGVSTYILVGSSNPAPHHHRLFDIDESSMAIALQWLDDIIRAAPYGPATSDVR